MQNVFEAFLWRSVVIAILVGLAIGGAMLVRSGRTWWRTARHGRRPVKGMPQSGRDNGVSGPAGEPATHRSTPARQAGTLDIAPDSNYREAA